MEFTIDDTHQKALDLTSPDSVVEKTVHLLKKLTKGGANPKNLEYLANSLKRFLEDSDAKKVIPKFSIIFESLGNAVEWIAEKENNRSKVHEHKKVSSNIELFKFYNVFVSAFTPLDEEDSSEEDETESIFNVVEDLPAMKTISLERTSYDKVAQAFDHLSIIAPLILGINSDDLDNYHSKMKTAQFRNALFQCLFKHKIIPSATRTAFCGPYYAAMLPPRLKAKFMEILKLCPKFSLTISGFFPLLRKIDEKHPERLEMLFQEIINKESLIPGSGSTARETLETLRSWKAADIMTRLSKDPRQLSRKHIMANKAKVKREKEIRKHEYRMYQNALGETLETVQHLEHCLQETDSLQDIIDVHEINLSTKDIVVFMVRLSTLVQAQSVNLVSELLAHPNFILFIYETSKIGDLASILATASAAEDMKAVPMHVWKKSSVSESGKREKLWKIAEGSVVATLSVKRCQLEDEDTKLLSYHSDRSPCTTLEAAFNYIGAKSVIAKIRCIVKVIDPIL